MVEILLRPYLPDESYDARHVVIASVIEGSVADPLHLNLSASTSS